MMQRGKHMKYTLDLLDNMEGHEFEYAVADLLRHNGFREVQVTQASNDYGIDILAKRKNTSYAMQKIFWKCWKQGSTRGWFRYGFLPL